MFAAFQKCICWVRPRDAPQRKTPSCAAQYGTPRSNPSPSFPGVSLPSLPSWICSAHSKEHQPGLKHQAAPCSLASITFKVKFRPPRLDTRFPETVCPPLLLCLPPSQGFPQDGEGTHGPCECQALSALGLGLVPSLLLTASGACSRHPFFRDGLLSSLSL